MERINAVSITPKNNPQQQSNRDNPNDAKEDGDDSVDMQKQPHTVTLIYVQSELQPLIDQLNLLGESQSPHLLFEIQTSKTPLSINMSDRETRQLLRNIPANEFFDIAKELLNEGTSLSEHPGQWINLDV